MQLLRAAVHVRAHAVCPWGMAHIAQGDAAPPLHLARLCAPAALRTAPTLPTACGLTWNPPVIFHLRFLDNLYAYM